RQQLLRARGSVASTKGRDSPLARFQGGFPEKINCKERNISENRTRNKKRPIGTGY
ncbi:hypothetical protein L9F63_002569, partial [Diploptera punctata]